MKKKIQGWSPIASFEERKGFQWLLFFSLREAIHRDLILLAHRDPCWEESIPLRIQWEGTSHQQAMVTSTSSQSPSKQSFSPLTLFILGQKGEPLPYDFHYFCLKLPLAFRQNLRPLDTYRWLTMIYSDTSVKYGGKYLRKVISPLWREYTEVCIPLQNLENIRPKGLCVCVCQRGKEAESPQDRNTERMRQQLLTFLSLRVKPEALPLVCFTNYPLTVSGPENQPVHK